jgi:Amt family ammonium transporter
MTRIRWFVTLALLAASIVILLAVSLSWAAEADSVGSSLSQAIAFLFPTGLTLVAWSALPADRSDRVAELATLALALALIGYLAIGFGLHFGGAAFISDNAELKNLARFFSLVRGDDSAGWGFFGLEGFFLGGDAATPTALQLFVSQLPLVTSMALIVMLALPGQTPLLAQLLTGLIASAVTFPLAGHWVSGGGWLARLGDTLALGHGLVDFAGAGTVFVVGAATVMAAALVFGRQRPSSTESESAPEQADSVALTRSPLLASLGALLSAVGWIALGLSNPLYAEGSVTLNWSLIALNGLAGLAGGTLLAQLYSWFTNGRFDPLMGPRGALAGLIAVSAGAPFMPTWAALITGAVAGLLLPLAVYAVDQLLRFDDVTAAIAGYGLPGLWGLLAVAVFADGRWGQSWNGVGGHPGAGVSGLLVAPGLRPDSGQLAAQVWGGIALFALGFILPWGVFRFVAALARLRLPGKKRIIQSNYASAELSNPSGESHSTPGGLDRVVNADDGG